VERNVAGWCHGLNSVNPGILICALWREMWQDMGNGLFTVNPVILMCVLRRGMWQDAIMALLV
jgi:hypothetical protein